MDLILEQFLPEFNICPEDCNYYANFRKFKNGSIEVLTKIIRPMQQYQAGLRYASGGVIAHRPDDLSEEEKERIKQDNHERSVRRARQKIRHLCKQLGADRLLTLTYRENMQDREQVKANFKEFLRLVRKVYPAWRYVAVLELQDRGAYHIHVAVQGYQKITFIRSCWYKALGGSSRDSGVDTKGQVDITSPRNVLGVNRRQWQTNKLAGYLTKYLDKTFAYGLEEKKRYWHARDLVVPEKKRIWLVATNMPDAIMETWRIATNLYRMNGSCFHWLCDAETDYFLSGDIDEGCPF